MLIHRFILNVPRDIQDKELPKPTVEKIYIFAVFLTTPMGRCLSPITIQQHKSELRLLSFYAPTHHPNNLLSKNMLNNTIGNLMLPYKEGGRPSSSKLYHHHNSLHQLSRHNVL